MTTGERIRARRKALGRSAEWLAESIGVSYSTIYRYENGFIEKCPGDVLVSIAEALNTTPAYLMGWEDDPYMHPVPSDLSLRWLDPESEEYKIRVEKLSQYGIDIDENALTTSRSLSDNENALLMLFRKLPPEVQETYLHRLEDSLKNLGLA